MPTTAINGTDLYYEEVGQGQPCLVMHGGLGFDHAYLAASLGPLAERLRLVFYDHRCNGRSGRPPLETLTMGQLADDAHALLAHLGIERPIVFGHSYGGFVAQEYAIRHPDRPAGLILVDTTPGQLGETESPDDEQGPPPPAELIELFSTPVTNDEEMAAMADALLPFYVHGSDLTTARQALEGTIFNAQASNRSMEVLAGWSAVDRLGTIGVPTLALAGRHDLVTSPPQAHRIASGIPGAEVVIFEESGHFPWFEEPEAFFGVINAWLDRHGLA